MHLGCSTWVHPRLKNSLANCLSVSSSLYLSFSWYKIAHDVMLHPSCIVPRTLKEYRSREIGISTLSNILSLGVWITDPWTRHMFSGSKSSPQGWAASLPFLRISRANPWTDRKFSAGDFLVYLAISYITLKSWRMSSVIPVRFQSSGMRYIVRPSLRSMWARSG